MGQGVKTKMIQVTEAVSVLPMAKEIGLYNIFLGTALYCIGAL